MKLINFLRKIKCNIEDLFRMSSYSYCKNCYKRWDKTNPHIIQINKHWGMLPICEECWKNVSDEDILNAANRLYDSWINGDIFNKPRPVEEMNYTREEMIEAVKKALEERKLQN